MEQHANRSSTRICCCCSARQAWSSRSFSGCASVPVIGYIVASMLIGPSASAARGPFALAGRLSISDTASIAFVGELGVVMLLFMIGLGLSRRVSTPCAGWCSCWGRRSSSCRPAFSALPAGCSAFPRNMPPCSAWLLRCPRPPSWSAPSRPRSSSPPRSGGPPLDPAAPGSRLVAILLFIGSLGRGGGPRASSRHLVGVRSGGDRLHCPWHGARPVRAAPFLRLSRRCRRRRSVPRLDHVHRRHHGESCRRPPACPWLRRLFAGLCRRRTEFQRAGRSLIDPLQRAASSASSFVSSDHRREPSHPVERPLLLMSAMLGIVAVEADRSFALMRTRLFGLRSAPSMAALLAGPGGECGFIAVRCCGGGGNRCLRSRRAAPTLIIAVEHVPLPFISPWARRLNRHMDAARPLPPEASVEPPSDDRRSHDRRRLSPVAAASPTCSDEVRDALSPSIRDCRAW